MEEKKEQMRKLKPSEERVWEKYYPEEAKHFDYPRTNIYDAVYDENRNRKDAKAIEYEGTDITYGQFFDMVDQKTDFFASEGLKENDIVTVSMLMSPDFIADWYALARLNVVTNLIDPRTSPEGIREYIEEAQSDYILNTNLFTPKILKAIGKDPHHVINYSLGNYAKKIPGAFGVVSKVTTALGNVVEIFDDRFNTVDEYDPRFKENPTLTLPGYKENQPLTIVHTGGTTGFPKGVVLSHDNYNAMAYEYKESQIGFSRNDRFLLVMPPWISYGSGMLHMSMITGMVSHVISKLDSKKMDMYILRDKPQWFAGVPAHFKMVANSKKIKENDISFLKAGAVGGGAVSAQLFGEADRALVENGAQKGVYPGYALTEATSAFAVRQLGPFKPGSVGIPLPGGTVGVFKFDEDARTSTDEELDYGETGEICLRTPNMMLGYFNNEEKTNEVLRKHSDGNIWIHTGDLGHVDNDGFIFIDGRIKEMITRYDGFKVYPSLIEKVINTIDEVSACKVVGVEDRDHGSGEVPKAFIVFKDSVKDNKYDETMKKIMRKCKATLPEYYVEGSKYETIEKLPLTPLGKVDFMALKELDKQQNHSKVKKM